MDGLNDEIESILYICREISVYKIPPMKANEGHRAGDWGNLSQPLWKGRLRVIEKISGAALLFEDSNTGELFARADYPVTKPSVEAVLDSSRYFVVRVENEGRKAYIGMGFTERSDSFDFNVAMQDYAKRAKAALNPPSPTETSTVSSGPKKDYTLKEGQTFSIALPGSRAKEKDSGNFNSTTDMLEGIDLLGGTTTSTAIGQSSSASSSSGGFPILAPPPGGSGFRLPPPPSSRH